MLLGLFLIWLGGFLCGFTLYQLAIKPAIARRGHRPTRPMPPGAVPPKGGSAVMPPMRGFGCCVVCGNAPDERHDHP